MTEHVTQLGGLRIGRTDIGEAVLTIDDDTLVFVVRADRDERALRVPLASIDTLRSDDAEIALTLRDGTTIHLDATPGLLNEIVARCYAIPELTRTLRSFGSRRGRQIADAELERVTTNQRRFFSPLLEARRAAGHAHGAAAISAFDAAALARSLDETLRTFAAERFAQSGPARRALEAELEEVSEPLVLALTTLARFGGEAAAASHDLRAWREWSTQLRATFESADRVWIALEAVLSGVPSRG